MNILIIGQTSLQWGRMEFGNIGNYYIIEPFIRELHRVFPEALIKTTLQMSDRFCMDENVSVLPLEAYYDFSRSDNLQIVKNEIELVEEFLEKGVFSDSTTYIRELLDTDIVIDFSGDIWGDNANLIGQDRFEVGLLKDMIAQKLKKPTFMIAGSPGPFNELRTKELARVVFRGFTAVTNREPISKCILIKEGFDISKVKDLACPAFLFEPAKGEHTDRLIREENLFDNDKPVIGFIMCGWNFLEGPFNKWPIKDEEYRIFAEAVEFISNELNAKVCLMSHSNGFPIPPAKFELLHGRDFPIIKQLLKIVKKRGIAKDVYALEGVYDAWTTKAIIGKFDMLVSGRVHAAVAGFSQYVPTVIIDYGHEPKAHKLLGFATVAGQEQFVADPAKKSDLISKIEKCWRQKDEVKKNLMDKIPHVRELAKDNFRYIKEVLYNQSTEV